MMNKDWVRWPRGDKPYQNALQKFMDMTCENLGNPSLLSCPCVDCKNLAEPKPPDEVHFHLLRRGMDPTYTEWVLHGEKDSGSNEVVNHEEGGKQVEDGATRTFYQMWTEANVEGYSPIGPGHETRQDEGLANHVEEADMALYPGCTTHTKLSITIELYRHKTVNGISRKAFDDLLKTTGSMLPPGHCLPKSTWEVKKLLKAFQLTYEKIHACVNDCCLFRNELKDADECPKCKYSRWKEDKSNLDDDNPAEMVDKPKKKIPVKVLRYFPIIPRLKRLYKSAELAEQLIWHATHKSRDGKMRHPTDSLAWSHIDQKFTPFAADSRNLRLGLAADGFNPFGDLSSMHSCWPVMLVVYNLPPQLCMQADNIILSMLIPGKKQPGRDIDVYLQPLIDDLIQLWENGVQAYDAFTKTEFNLKAILMWTINDFPAYGNLSGCTYKGYSACPICGDNTASMHLPSSKKIVYMNHRRFLPCDHPYRTKADLFDGEIEMKDTPPVMTGAEVLERQSSIVNDFGKHLENEEEKRKAREARIQEMKKNKKKGRTRGATATKKVPSKCNKKGQSSEATDANDGKSQCGKRKRAVPTHAGQSVASSSRAKAAARRIIFNKRSIFFDLPYWKELLLRHNLDVMHTEKNVCESLVGTILNIQYKTKDGLAARNDLVDMGIREQLHPQVSGTKTWLPPAQYSLRDVDKQKLYKRMRNLKVPYGYSSDIRKHFWKENSLGALKAHDYHVLMQQILPVALKDLLPQGPSKAINRLCSYFNDICQRTVDLDRLVQLEEEIVETMCMLEMYFPPSFFDIMIHLTIHLAREVRLCGPVQYRWMYPFERYMKIFKDYVKNTAQPEACIAECYLGMEAVRFFNVHAKKPVDHPSVSQSRNDEVIEQGSTLTGRPLSKGVQVCIGIDQLNNAHRYVLFNTPEVDPYRTMHMDELRCNGIDGEELIATHSSTFTSWFKQKVNMQTGEGISLSDRVVWLAMGPLGKCMSYKGLLINGSRFLTKDVKRVTQNSGVSIESNTFVEEGSEMKGFYGVLEQILVLDYNMFQIPLFKCDWANCYSGVKLENGFTLVNLRQYKNQFKDDSFILATQARQVFYSRESDTSNWCVVLKPPPRGFHELEEYNEGQYISCQAVDPSTFGLNMTDEVENQVRIDAEPILVEPIKKKKNMKKKNKCL